MLAKKRTRPLVDYVLETHMGFGLSPGIALKAGLVYKMGANPLFSPRSSRSTSCWPQSLLCMWHMGLAWGEHCPRCTGWTQYCRQQRGLVWSAACCPHPGSLDHMQCSVQSSCCGQCSLCWPHVPYAQASPGASKYCIGHVGLDWLCLLYAAQGTSRGAAVHAVSSWTDLCRVKGVWGPGWLMKMVQ